MAKKSPVGTSQPTQVAIHECNTKVFQHRILVVKDGLVDTGAWYQYSDIAYHKSGLFANLEAHSPLPVGLFRVSRVQSQQVE